MGALSHRMILWDLPHPSHGILWHLSRVSLLVLLPKSSAALHRTLSIMASTEEVFARVGKCENVRITAAEGIKLPNVLESTPFKDWAKSMDEDLIINNVHIQSVDYFGKRVGFIKFISEVTDAEVRG